MFDLFNLVISILFNLGLLDMKLMFELLNLGNLLINLYVEVFGHLLDGCFVFEGGQL